MNADWRKDKKARRKCWVTWYNMKWRCENPNAEYYHRYGGRGIRVCEEWHDFDAFMNWSYESGYDPYAEFAQCTLDRIDNDGDYCPENCKWTDIKEQTKHTCRSNHVTYKGNTLTIIEWSELLGIPPMRMYKRSDLGMTPAEILYPGKLPVRRTQLNLERVVDARIATIYEERTCYEHRTM